MVDSSDGIMIDRGDLAAELSLIAYSLLLKKSQPLPSLLVTIDHGHNLETMISRDLPSKSEVISLAHSASIGVDCICGEETALSENSMVIVDWLTNF